MTSDSFRTRWPVSRLLLDFLFGSVYKPRLRGIVTVLRGGASPPLQDKEERTVRAPTALGQPVISRL
jgi:hypothetical protein